MAGSKRIPLIRPRAIGLRTVTPCSIPSLLTSSTYRAWPVTFARPSLRRTERPICGAFICLILACCWLAHARPAAFAAGFHLDFEDGYGNRSDAEEDGHAESAAV